MRQRSSVVSGRLGSESDEVQKEFGRHFIDSREKYGNILTIYCYVWRNQGHQSFCILYIKLQPQILKKALFVSIYEEK